MDDTDLAGIDWDEPFNPNENKDEKLENITPTDSSGPELCHLEALRHNFGHSSFRPMQWQIIRSIIVEKKDVCAVMATGYGKSLTYQFPPVACYGLSIVISPLISLMQDQVHSLEMLNIPAFFLGSGQCKTREVEDKLFSGLARVLYLTPEFCDGDYGTNLLQRLNEKIKVVMIAIDEAHCVSQWGHDFRAAYRKLGNLRKLFPNVPLLAVTATATPAVREDICKSLLLRNPNVVVTGFDRPNLYLSASNRTSDEFGDLKKFMIRDRDGVLKFEGPTIIYCRTQKTAECLFQVLRIHQINCDFYHAGRAMKQRHSVHEAFLRDDIDVVIATVAFGMGIDKPDVRCIIHHGTPQDIESYYQEIGRAGRDGLPAKCHVYHSPSDSQINQYFLKNLSGRFRQHKEEMSALMQSYLDLSGCRRQYLLSHFEGEKLKPPQRLSKNCCDNCTNKIKHHQSSDDTDVNHHDFTNDTVDFLQAVLACKEKYGLAKAVYVLRGAQRKEVYDSMKRCDIFGKGKAKSEEWWKGIGRMLIKEGYLEKYFPSQGHKQKFIQPTIRVAQKGKNFLSQWKKDPNSCSVLLEPTAELKPLLRVKMAVATVEVKNSDLVEDTSSKPTESNEKDDIQMLLYRHLVQVRKKMAEEQSCAPFHLASNRAMIQMSVMRPTHTSQLSEITDFNQTKIQKDGERWIKSIADFFNSNGWNTTKDDLESRNSDTKLNTLSTSERESYVKFHHQQMSVEGICREMNLRETAVMENFCRALQIGLPFNLKRIGIDDILQQEIAQVLSLIDPDFTQNWTALKLGLPGVSDLQVKLVISYLKGGKLNLHFNGRPNSIVPVKVETQVTGDQKASSSLSWPGASKSTQEKFQYEEPIEAETVIVKTEVDCDKISGIDSVNRSHSLTDCVQNNSIFETKYDLSCDKQLQSSLTRSHSEPLPCSVSPILSGKVKTERGTKRQTPEWLSKPTKSENVKKLKKCTLFKL